MLVYIVNPFVTFWTTVSASIPPVLLCACMHARAYVRMCPCMCVSVYVCVCVCNGTCTFTQWTMSLAPPRAFWRFSWLFFSTWSHTHALFFFSSGSMCVWYDSRGCHILLQSPENIAFLWSLTKLLIVWLWKEEFSPDFRTVCFCLIVQKAHPGRELRS